MTVDVIITSYPIVICVPIAQPVNALAKRVLTG